MTDFEIAKLILFKIVNEDLPFAISTKAAYKKYDVSPSSRSNITALLGCTLRHHYLLDNLIERHIEGKSFLETIYLRFLIVNKRFLKRYNDKELYELASNEVDKSVIDEIIDLVSTTNEIIPTELDKTSPEYLAMRFNTPSWVIRMWQKQYGKGLAYKILKTNYHQSVPSVRINNQLTTAEKVLSKNPDFSISPVEDILIYQGRGTPKALEEFKNNSIFFMKMGTKYVIDRLDIEPLKGMVLYSDVPNNIYLDMVSRFGSGVKMDIITNHLQSYFEMKKIVEAAPYNGISLYNAKATSVITCVSRPVGTVLCLPKSTTFDLLRSTPDYFLRIKQDKLDSIIKDELEALEECSKVTEVDGKLVYMIPTICKKESSNLIADFLSEHPNFDLVEERQFFPFESFDSCLYYAILEKKEA